jgi:hypothetical protein
MSDKKNIAPAFRKTWSVQPLSYVYYFVVWGVPIDRSIQILKDLLPGRSQDSITSVMWKVRAYLTAKRNNEKNPKWIFNGLSARIDQASKQPVSSNIARFKDEGKGFKPVSPNNKRVKATTVTPMPEPESPFTKQKLVRPMAESEQPVVVEPAPHKPQVPKWMEEHNKKVEEKSFSAAEAGKILGDIPWKFASEASLASNPSVLEEIKAMITFARSLVATEVEYKDVKVKF